MIEIPAWFYIPLGLLVTAMAVLAWVLLITFSQQLMRRYYEAREERAEAKAIAAEREREATERTLILRKSQIDAEREIQKLEAQKKAAARDTKDIARGLDLDLDAALADVKKVTAERDACLAKLSDTERKAALLDKSLRETMAREDETQQMLERAQRENKDLKMKQAGFDRAKQDRERLEAARDATLNRRK